MNERLGFSGRVARFFLGNQLTPLLAVAALLLGVFAMMVTPREEEPQIDVTFANIFVAFPGASSQQVEDLVATPMEKVLGEISGVEHISSVSSPGMAVLSVQFEVGEPRTEAIVRLYNAVYSNQDWRPANSGVLQPLIKPRGIDDVPIITVTLWTSDPARGGHELGQVARSIESEIQRIPGTRNVTTIGSPRSALRVRLDPQKLSAHGLTISDLQSALEAANFTRRVGELVGDGRLTPVDAGTFLADRDDVAGVVVSARDGRPVFLEDVATVTSGPEQPDSYAWMGTGPGAAISGLPDVAHAPAVTLAVSKKPGENASDVAADVIRRIEQLRGVYIPQGVEATVTRNYGVTADDKASKLIQKLLFATVSVVLLVVLAMGRREALVVGAAVLITLAATLFASWAWGFTINRVSLFALIFSIGILVDDAIVVVENIHRHSHLGGGAGGHWIPRAVDEVGGPTILATFTVLAALLPMAFVSGLMGPYMSPIPINSSMGMLISLAVALVFTPWMCRRVLSLRAAAHAEPENRRLRAVFDRFLRPFLGATNARQRRHRLYWSVLAAIVLATSLVAVRWVVLKMLPFDNKSEFQVVVNLPEGTPIEGTARVLTELSQVIATVPEVSDFQAYAGTAAPINFNGLVRQYYLRASPELGDLQVNLVDKHHRSRQSHDVVVALRPALAAIGRKYGASVQLVEVPPGPPVLAPIVAEIYGPDYGAQRALAARIRQVFDETTDIVDVDDSLEAGALRYVLAVDRQKAAHYGISQQQVVELIAAALDGSDATFAHPGRERYPIPVHIELSAADKADLGALLSLEARAADGGGVPLSELLITREAEWDQSIHHKDLLPVVYVTGDMAGELDSPLYGMFAMVGEIGGREPDVRQRFIASPDDPAEMAIKWDGEWQITYETFRDMGLAYSVGLILIYLLVVAQFGSYVLPLIIMAPIPLTVIGVMPGHALLGAQFTATSMIGMIALAGIIVRNSILLVDFIDQEVAAGRGLEDAVVRAGVIRAKPIALTALAAMIGAFFILDDPIFNGLAVSLIFGILVSTALTLLVIPVVYYAYLKRKPPRVARQE